jgi:hypothetical protein
MDDNGILSGAFSKMFDESDAEPCSCANCNNGVESGDSCVCCVNKVTDCKSVGKYKYWEPIVQFGDEEVTD